MNERERFEGVIKNEWERAKLIQKELESVEDLMEDEFDEWLGYNPTSELGRILNLQSDFGCAKGHLETVIYCLEQVIAKLDRTYKHPPPIGIPHSSGETAK